MRCPALTTDAPARPSGPLTAFASRIGIMPPILTMVAAVTGVARDCDGPRRATLFPRGVKPVEQSAVGGMLCLRFLTAAERNARTRAVPKVIWESPVVSYLFQLSASGKGCDCALHDRRFTGGRSQLEFNRAVSCLCADDKSRQIKPNVGPCGEKDRNDPDPPDALGNEFVYRSSNIRTN